MRLPERDFEGQVGGWKFGVLFCPGILMIGIHWDGDPSGIGISIPFATFWIERDGGKSWPWDWTLFRIVIGKQEFRFDLALNIWSIGIKVHETDDWSIHLGPIDIECEYDKFYDDDLYIQPPALLRLFSKARVPSPCELEAAQKRASRPKE